jgi:DnaK suppressor protein
MIAPRSSAYSQLELPLRNRLEELRTQIENALHSDNADRYATTAEQVHDFKDQALSTQQASIDHAEIARDLKELRDVEAALTRMTLGLYGQCIQCSRQIPPDRLMAFPSAARCLSCQRLHERVPAYHQPTDVA